MRILFILLSLISIVSCDNKFTPPDGYIELKDNSPRISTLGAIFSPPSGNKWFEKYNGESIVFVKQTDPDKISLSAAAFEKEIKEKITSKENFLNFVKSYKYDFTKNTNRYKNPASSFIIDSSIAAYCVTYKQKVDVVNDDTYKVLTIKGLICLHPVKRNYIIDVYYTSRAIPGLDHTILTQEAEDFINSLNFDANLKNE